MNISAVIVTYNRVKLLKKCLRALLMQKYPLNNIFVINNHSNDGTKKYLNSLNNKKIHSVNVNRNLGGAGGFSLGTKIAYEKSNATYFWLMDDDTMPTDTALSELAKSSKVLDNHFGYLCSNVRWWKNNEPSYLNVPVASKDWNYYINYGLVKTVSASFVSLLVPRKLVSELGLPIANMFIWGDDVEYTTRLSRKYPSYFVSSSIVKHNSANNSTNESICNVSMNRLFYYKCMFRNRLYISRKFYSKKKTIKLMLEYFMYVFKILLTANDHKTIRIKNVLEGIFNGLLFNPIVHFPSNK